MEILIHKNKLARLEFTDKESPDLFYLKQIQMNGTELKLLCFETKRTRGLIHFVSYDFFGCKITGHLKLDEFQIIEESK